MCCAGLSHVRLSVTPWTVGQQDPLSMGVSGREYRSGLPCSPPGDLPNPGSNPGLLHCRQILYQLSHQGSPLKGHSWRQTLQLSLTSTSADCALPCTHTGLFAGLQVCCSLCLDPCFCLAPHLTCLYDVLPC